MYNNDKRDDVVNLIKTHIFAKLDAYQMAILKCVWGAPDGGTIEELLQTLRSQQRDNEGVLYDVIGFDAAEALKELIP